MNGDVHMKSVYCGKSVYVETHALKAVMICRPAAPSFLREWYLNCAPFPCLPPPAIFVLAEGHTVVLIPGICSLLNCCLHFNSVSKVLFSVNYSFCGIWASAWMSPMAWQIYSCRVSVVPLLWHYKILLQLGSPIDVVAGLCLGGHHTHTV